MIWRWQYTAAVVLSAAHSAALWYGVGAIVYWLFGGRA